MDGTYHIANEMNPNSTSSEPRKVLLTFKPVGLRGVSTYCKWSIVWFILSDLMPCGGRCVDVCMSTHFTTTVDPEPFSMVIFDVGSVLWGRSSLSSTSCISLGMVAVSLPRSYANCWLQILLDLSSSTVHFHSTYKKRKIIYYLLRTKKGDWCTNV